MKFKVTKNNRFTPSQLKIPLHCLSIKGTLQQQLSMSVILLDNRVNLSGKNTCDSDINANSISLFKLPSFPITYRCALAYPLATSLKLPVSSVAHQLQKSLLKLTEQQDCHSSWEFSLQIIPPGWLDFQLSEQSLALWLEQIHSRFCHTLTGKTPIHSPLQYTHNRCFSLLHSAHRHSLIKLIEHNHATETWQWLEPKPIPWIIVNTGFWQLNHPSERYLIDQFCTSVDALGELNPARREKLGMNLSAALLDFESNCRIWGEAKIHSPTLVQARLGLIAICHGLLGQLL